MQEEGVLTFSNHRQGIIAGFLCAKGYFLSFVFMESIFF